MAPKTKEPVKEPTPAPEPAAPSGIPPTIGGPDEPETDEGPTLTPEMQALQDSNEALKKQLEEAGTRETATLSRLDQLLAAPAAVANVPLAVTPAAPLEDLPDPTLNPNEFAKALNDRIVAGAKAAVAPLQTANTQAQKIAELRSTLQTRHPALADFSDLVEVEVKRRVLEASSAGRDPEAMMFTNIPGFVDEVAKAVETRLEVFRGPVKEPAEEKPTRDVLLSGGGPAMVDTGKKGEKKPPSFIDQLKKAQRDSGMF